MPRPAASATALVTSSLACPSIIGPQERTKSTYSLPSTSNRWEPLPLAIKAGWQCTLWQALTGLFTPPGISSQALANKSSDLEDMTTPVRHIQRCDTRCSRYMMKSPGERVRHRYAGPASEIGGRNFLKLAPAVQDAVFLQAKFLFQAADYLLHLFAAPAMHHGIELVRPVRGR